MSRHQLSRIKRANLPYIAADVESILKEAPGAPGNTPPLPPPVRKPRRTRKLELADAEITRCKWCGTWALDYTCTYCTEHGFPTIDDIERTA